MRWSFDPGFDAAANAALDTGKPLLYECPTAVWMVAPLFEQLVTRDPKGNSVLALAPDCGIVPELARHLNADRHVQHPDDDGPLVFPVSGLARAAVAFKNQSVTVVVATPSDALALLGRSVLAADSIRHAVLLWPERYTEAELEPIELLLGDMPRAQRLIVTENGQAVTHLVERYAHRAPTMRAVALPDAPGDGVRAAVASSTLLPQAVAAVLDTFAPTRALLWDPYPVARARWVHYDGDKTVQLVTDQVPSPHADVAIATDLPSPEVLDLLRTHADRVVILHRAYQRKALDMIAAPVRELSISPEAHRARRAAIELRQELRSQLGRADLTGEMLELAPLFDEYDPAAVAAALVRRGGVVAATPHYPSWVRIRLDVGKRDRIKPGDIVGALINAADTPKDHIGQIDLRESFSVVEVRTESAEAAVRGLGEVALRGRPANPKVETK